jgi:hypothetical protein
MQFDEDILDYWFEKKNLSKNTRELYTLSMNQYSNITSKPIIGLYHEADNEEEQHIKLDKRKYSFYSVKYKKPHNTNIPNSCKIILQCIWNNTSGHNIGQRRHRIRTKLRPTNKERRNTSHDKNIKFKKQGNNPPDGHVRIKSKRSTKFGIKKICRCSCKRIRYRN